MDIQQPAPNVISTVTGSMFVFEIVEIGPWNMDTTAFKNINVTTPFEKIIKFEAFIQNDAQDTKYPIDWITPTGGDVACGTIRAVINVPALIRVDRVTGRSFDAVQFSSTAINRGWILLTSLP